MREREGGMVVVSSIDLAYPYIACVCRDQTLRLAHRCTFVTGNAVRCLTHYVKLGQIMHFEDTLNVQPGWQLVHVGGSSPTANVWEWAITD